MKIQGKLWMAAAVGLLFINCSSSNKNIELIRAAKSGDTHKVQKLLQKGANINAVDEEGWTPYLAASTNGHLETMRYLKNAGARTDVPADDYLR